MRVTGPDHVVLVSPDPERLVAWYGEVLGLPAERLEQWRANEVPFVSLRVSPTFLIDVMLGQRSGVNIDHVAFVAADADLEALAAERADDVVFGPADLWGAQGTGRGLNLRDPDGNQVELRTYPEG